MNFTSFMYRCSVPECWPMHPKPVASQLAHLILSQPLAPRLRGQGQAFLTRALDRKDLSPLVPFFLRVLGYPPSDLSRKCDWLPPPTHPHIQSLLPTQWEGIEPQPKQNKMRVIEVSQPGTLLIPSPQNRAAQDYLWQPGIVGWPEPLERPRLKQQRQNCILPRESS